jgi:hypothetical protein
MFVLLGIESMSTLSLVVGGHYTGSTQALYTQYTGIQSECTAFLMPVCCL